MSLAPGAVHEIARTVTPDLTAEMRHLAATPVGMAVRGRATLLETDGRRILFQVEAWDATEKIAEGRHETILDRAMKKGQR